MKDLLNITTLNIDLYTKTLYPKDYLKTEDINSRYKYFKLHYNGEVINLDGLTIRAFMIKPDGKEVYQDLTVENGLVVLGFSSQALAAEGTLRVEIVLSDKSTTVELSSFIIEYQVVKSLRTDSAIESSNEYSALQTLLQKVDLVLTSYETLYSTWDERFLALKNLKESELNKLKTDKEALLDQLYRTKETALDGLKTAKESALNTLYTTKETELNKLKSDKNIELTNLYTARDTDLKNLQAAWDAKFKTKYDNLEVEYAEGLKEVKTIEETKEGSYLTFNNTVPAPITNVIVKGNTVQNPTNLADIKSTGIQLEDGMFEYEAVVVGENLCPGVELGYINNSTGEFTDSSTVNRMTKLVRVNPGATVTFTKDNIVRATNKFYYDINKKFLRMGTDTSVTFTIPNDVYYLGLSFGSTPEPGNFMLKYVDGVTSYVPYVEKRVKFKLPCQLERIEGRQADILYYDKNINVWCIDKYVMTINPLDHKWTRLESYATCSRMTIHSDSLKTLKPYPTSKILCNALKFLPGNEDEPHTRVDGSTPYGGINLYISVLNASQEDVYKFAMNNNMFLKYPMLEPQKIVLPKDTQIELNSLLGQANMYVNSGEISATISATVSKSMGATVKAHEDKINRIDSELSDIQSLKESSDYEYSTDKGYELCRDTKPGVVKGLKVYGRSLVNYFRFRSQTTISTNIYVNSQEGISDNITGGKTLRVFNTTGKQVIVDINSNGLYKRSVILKPTDSYKDFVTTIDEYVSCIYGQTKDGWNSESDSDKKLLKDMCILLDDLSVTTKPSYFEGIQSVKNSNGLEVSTLKWKGNLFDDRVLKPYIKSETDSEYVIDYGLIWSNRVKLVDLPFKINTSYKFICTQKASDATTKPRFYFHYTDGTEDQVTIANIDWTTVTAISNPGKTLEYVSATYGNSGGTWTIKKNSICLYEDTSKTIFEPYIEDKKPVLFKDMNGEWKPVTELKEWDILDTAKSKLEINSEKFTPTASTDWRDNQNPNVDYKTFWKKFEGYKLFDCKCDKLSTYKVTSFDKKCVFVINNEYLYITIPKSECADLTQLEQWFKTNPLNILIPSPKKEYEINSLSVDAYEGDTLVTFNSSPIPVKADWKLTSYINNMVKENTRRTDNLEDVVAELLTDFTDNESEELLNTNCKSFKAGLGTSNGVSRDYSNTMRKSLLKLDKITGKSIRTPRGNLYNVMLNAVSSSVAPIDVLSQKVASSLKVTYTNTGGTLTVTSVDAAWGYVQFEVPVEPNSDYMLAMDFNEVSGNMWVAVSTSSDSSQPNYNIMDINFEHMAGDNIFNVGNHSKIYLRFYSNVKISEGNKVVSYTNVKLIKANGILETGIPLRSLPHGVTDVLEGNMVTRRIKRFYLKDAPEWKLVDGNKTNKAYSYKIPDTLNVVDKTKILLNCNYYNAISDQTMASTDQTAVSIGSTSGELILACQIGDGQGLKQHLQTIAPHAYVEVEIYEEKQYIDINPHILCDKGDTIYFNNNVALPQVVHRVQLSKGAQIDELLESLDRNRMLVKDARNVVTLSDYKKGSTDNKYYTVFPDGTCIQWGLFNVTFNNNNTASGYVNYPLAFEGESFCTGNVATATIGAYSEYSASVVDDAEFRARVEVKKYNSQTLDGVTVRVNWIAIGRMG